MPNLIYNVADFQPFTKIISADVNSRFKDVKDLLNTTKLDSTNVQQYGLTRDRLAQTAVDAVVINNASGTMITEPQLAIVRGGLGQNFTSQLAANINNSIIVNAIGDGFTLGTPSVDRLTQQFVSDVPTLTCGEAIAVNDAVCLDVDFNGNYRYFKCDASTPNRKRTFLGMAITSGTATPQIQTFVTNANLVTSNVITYFINGRIYSTTFASSNDATMTAIATQIATDPDVSTCAVTGSTPFRTLTMTGKGAIPVSITGAVVTAGASQATITVTTTQAPVGTNIQVRNFGDCSGFIGLTPTSPYYVGTAGGITAIPSDTDAIPVGQALSSTILFVNTNVGFYSFGTTHSFVRSHGNTLGDTAGSQTGTAENFNFTSWSTLTSDTTTKTGSMGEGALAGFLFSIGGHNQAGTILASVSQFNKSTWTAGTARPSARQGTGVSSLSTTLYAINGATGNGNSGVTDALDAFSGTSWNAAVANFPAAYWFFSSFTQGGKIRCVGGIDASSAATDRHDTYNGSSVSTDTVSGLTSYLSGGSRGPASTGITGTDNGTMNAKYWNGSAWASSNATYISTQANSALTISGSHHGYSTTGSAYMNGGSEVAATSTNKTNRFNGTSYSSDTSSSFSRAGGSSGVF